MKYPINRYILIVFSLLLTLVGTSSSCRQTLPINISYNNKNIDYVGRFSMNNDSAAIIYWSGTSIEINFEGTELSATLKDEYGTNFFYVIIDNNVFDKINPDTTKNLYKLASNLSSGKHSLKLIKLTECTHGRTWLYGFSLKENGKVLPPTTPRKRKMEFYGNSITSGYSLEDRSGDSGNPKYFNNYFSYAAITARNFNADYHCISKSGIGLMLSWFPIIMPELYDRLDPEDSTIKWDFTKYTPDIVVIKILQNDSWLVHKQEHLQFKARFGNTPPNDEFIINSYKSFIISIRNKYPNAHIICALGGMDATKENSVWPNYIKNAVAQLNDSKIYTLFFPYTGIKTHPKKNEHKAMANILIKFIDENIKW